MKRSVSAIVLIVLLAGAVGFHWITYPAPGGRTFCVIPKEHLSFRETLLTSDSQIGFAFKHPMLAGKIMMNDAWCFGI